MIALEEGAVAERRRIDHGDAAAPDRDAQRVDLAAVAQRPGSLARSWSANAANVDAADLEAALADVFGQPGAHSSSMNCCAGASRVARRDRFSSSSSSSPASSSSSASSSSASLTAGPALEFLESADQRVVHDSRPPDFDPVLDALAARPAQVPVPGRQDDHRVGPAAR